MKGYIQQGDCLELMRGIPNASVDMILCDLPYGVTACMWDMIIPPNYIWKEYKQLRGKYLLYFTVANILFLVLLLFFNLC